MRISASAAFDWASRSRCRGRQASMVVLSIGCMAASAASDKQDDSLVCEKVRGGKEPFCIPRSVREMFGEVSAAMSTTLAMAKMAPDFCLDDARKATSADCKASAGSCVSRSSRAVSPPATGQSDAEHRLPMYLAYMAVLREPGGGSGDAGSLLAGVAAQHGEKGWELAYLQGALKSDLRAGDSRAVVNDMLMLAGVFIRSGDFVSANEYLQRASQSAGEGEPKAAVMANLGVLDALQGNYTKSIDQLTRAADLYRNLHASNPHRETEIAGSCEPTTLANSRKALAAKSVRTGLELSLIDLGTVHGQLGQFDRSMAYLRQATSIYEPLGGRGAGAGLLAMAAVSQRAKRAADALKFVDAAARSGTSLLLAWGATDSAGIGLQPGPSALATQAGRAPSDAASATLSSTAEAPVPQAAQFEPPAAALKVHRQAALVAEATGASDALRAALANLQRTAGALQQSELAIYYGKRAVNQIQQQRAELPKLSRDVRRSFAASSRPVYESLIEALFASDRLPEAERAMLLLHQDDLAEFASAEGRMPLSVAERAFEARDVALAARWRSAAARREAVLTKAPALRIKSPAEIDSEFDLMVRFVVHSLSAMEPLQTLTARLDPGKGAVSAGLQASGIERMLAPLECDGVDIDPRLVALRRKSIDLRKRQAVDGGADATSSATEVRRSLEESRADVYIQLKCSQFEQASIESIASASDDRLEASLRTTSNTLTDEDSLLLERNRNALAARAPGTAAAALHYLVTDRRLYILVITPTGRVVRSVDVGREAIEGEVDAFRRVMQAPNIVPLAAAAELHAVLVAPVTDILDRERVSMLQLGLDGRLRYVPFAALHDGKQWLIERFAVALGRSSESRVASTGRGWRAAGFGTTVAAPGFNALPGVAAELQGLVQDPASPAGGVMPGIIRMNRGFTARALQDALSQRYDVVHIASHFALKPDSVGESFLLLGDGTRLSLERIRNEFRFDGVELITLSACETGLDARNSYGQEFEGLAAILRNLGAGSVLATLWSVADDSTRLLMRNFYAAHEQLHLSRVEALRAAQIGFIQGIAGNAPSMTRSPVSGPAMSDKKTDRTLAGRGASRLDAPSVFVPDPAAPYSHPFFWAPFVLSGDTF